MTSHGLNAHGMHWLVVELDHETLIRAARLGNIDVGADQRLIDDPDLITETLNHYARGGIAYAINESFERAFPTRYPDDVEGQFPW